MVSKIAAPVCARGCTSRWSGFLISMTWVCWQWAQNNLFSRLFSIKSSWIHFSPFWGWFCVFKPCCSNVYFIFFLINNAECLKNRKLTTCHWPPFLLCVPQMSGTGCRRKPSPNGSTNISSRFVKSQVSFQLCQKLWNQCFPLLFSVFIF